MALDSQAPRENFVRITARHPEQINLALASLYIAAEDAGDVDVCRYMGILSGIAERLRYQNWKRRSLYGAVYAINDLLFDKMGFQGNPRDYYDIRNSHFNEVLDRKLGIPITLSVLYIEVAKRLGIKLRGANMSGHFLVIAGHGASLIYIDPFREGRIYSRWECLQATRRDGALQPNDPKALDRLQRAYLPEASNKAILARMLNNIKLIHTRCGDMERAVTAAERIQILLPGNWRNMGDIAQLQGRSGNVRNAYRALAQMVRLMPSDVDTTLQIDALETLRPIAESGEKIDPEEIYQIPFFRI